MGKHFKRRKVKLEMIWMGHSFMEGIFIALLLIKLK